MMKIESKIRFNNSKIDWQQVKFKNLLNSDEGIRRGPFGSALKKELFVQNSEYVVYEQQNAIYDHFNTRYRISEEKYHELKKFILLPGDFIMSGAGTIGKISLVPEGIEKGVFNQALIRLKVNKSTDKEFFLQWMRSPEMQNKLTKANPASAMVNLVPMSEVKEWDVIVPSFTEQSAIGSLFRTLDDLLASYKDNLANYQSFKVAMLAKMFPKAGQTVPEIRLDGFEGEWEEKYIGELADIVRGASPRPIQDPKWFDLNSEIGWLRISDVTNQNGRIHSLEQKISKLGQEKTRVLTEPHLLLSIAATVGKPVVNYVKTGVHDGFLIFMNPKFDREFMFQWLEMFREKWNRYGQPGSQVNLNSDIVKNQKILVPCMEEQQAIGTYFSILDNLINSHQEKISQLETLKKKLLQDMFI